MQVTHKINDEALSRLASEVILLFPAGMEFTAEAILADFPHLAESRRAIFKVRLEEYLRRVDNQESIDVDEFVGRFPEIEASLRRQINLHSAYLRDPQQLEELLAPAWPAPDSQFLDWKIRRLIGRGGFSRVYLADEPKVGHRPVALKLTTRSGRECELVGRLSHPGICQILSVRDDDPSGITAIAMPFHGEATLHDLIEKTWEHTSTRATRELPDWGAGTSREFVEHVVTMAFRLCEALEYAHGRQVLHCDLKPSNILLKSDGSPLLLDFNLAFSMQEGSSVIGGTVGYMAPEQVRATLNRSQPIDVDARADVFGLGAVLYHVLSGRPAHEIDVQSHSDDRLETLLQDTIAKPPIPLQQRNAAVRREISEVIQRCLDPDPDRRPASVQAVREALERALPPAGHAPISRHRPVSRRIAVALSLVALMTIAGLTTALALKRPEPRAAEPNEQAMSPGATGSQSEGSINIDQEIARLEAIAPAEITPADRELLGYYLCLDEKWSSARDVLQKLVDDGLQSAAINHNLAYVVGQLSDYGDACRIYEDALLIDDSEGKSWAGLVHNETIDAMNHYRQPNPQYFGQATMHCRDAEIMELLGQLVERAHQYPAVMQGDSEQLRQEMLDGIQAILIALGELPPTRWLIAPPNLPSGSIAKELAAH